MFKVYRLTKKRDGYRGIKVASVAGAKAWRRDAGRGGALEFKP